MDVLGFGESSIDYVHLLPELPRGENAKLRISESFVSIGGQVATTLAACGRWGLKAGYLGPIGDDDDGRQVLQTLEGAGVDTSRVIVREARTRFAVILVQEWTGERTVLWNRDARLDVPVERLPALPAGVRIVHVDATDVTSSIDVARRSAEIGAIVTCDIDSINAHTEELLSVVTVPILAEHLPAEMTGIADTKGALRALRRPGHLFVCVTRGADGAAALAGDDYIEAAALEVSAVDTTAAGDVFRAGIILGLRHDWPVRRMLAFANAAAGLACTRRGAVSSIPSLEEVRGTLASAGASR